MNQNFKDEFKFVSNLDNSELTTSASFKSTLGSVLELADQIINDDVNNGVAFLDNQTSSFILSALIRFCFQKHNMKRILILNWDSEVDSVIQDEFYDNQRVLNVSIHRQVEPVDKADFIRIGENNAKGFNINIPLNTAGLGDSEFMAIFHNIILPVVYEFGPQLIIVPTCFDANSKAQMSLSPIAYEHFFNYLTSAANGKICFLVNDKNEESDSFGRCLSSAFNALLGYPCRRLKELKQPSESLIETVMNVIAIQRPFWYNLQLLNESDEISLEDFLEDYQKKKIEKNKESDRVKKENKVGELDVDLSQLSIADFKQRSCICSDELMTKHVNLIAP